MLDECCLHRMQRIGSAEAFDGGDRVPIVHHGQGEAGIDAAAVDVDGASAALAMVAALLGACQMQVLAQSVEQSGARVELDLAHRTVHIERNARDRPRGRGGCDAGGC